MTQGICRNVHCPAAARATPVDRYPGPGEYCPECGELLDPVASAEPAAPAAPPAQSAAPKPEAPFGGLTALQALQRFESENPPFPEPPARRRSAKPLVFASVAVVLAGLVAGFVVLRPAAMSRVADTGGVRVCRSSISERFASDVVSAYSVKGKVAASHFTVAHGGVCDVRFSAIASPDAAATVVGHDAIVAVVNPQNPVMRLTATALRGVLTGEITDWSQLGGRPGPITVAAPAESTDEGAAIAHGILSGARAGAGVHRFDTSADVVAAVAGPRGRTSLGVVAFSGAVPAKVLRLGSAPAPSMISIADHGYPLTVAVVVEAVGTAPPAAASDLVRYARSDDAQAIVARDGLVPLKGI